MKAVAKKEKEIWTIQIGKETIKFENKFSILKLYVNDKLQDVYLGSISPNNIRMYGRLNNGKEIKIVLGGDLALHCYIFVDNECILEDWY